MLNRCRETVLLLVAALALLGCDATTKPVLYGERQLTTNIDHNDRQFDQLALRIGEKIRQGKPKRYVLKWELRPEP